MIQCTFENGNKNSLRHAVVDILVLQKNKILLVKRRKDILEGGRWSLVGGYIERNETIEQAAEREISEETGWKVKNLKLLRINDNPNRPHEDRQNIAFIFTCQASEKIGDFDEESTEIKWFDLDKLPPKDLIAFDHFGNIEFYKTLSRNS